MRKLGKKRRQEAVAVAKGMLNRRQDGYRIEDLADHFFTIVGGMKEMARLVFDEYNSSRAGSLQRAKILDLVVRAKKWAEERHPVVDDMSKWSQEDLEDLLVGLVSGDDEDADVDPVRGESESEPIFAEGIETEGADPGGDAEAF